jgi:hypothetical protein
MTQKAEQNRLKKKKNKRKQTSDEVAEDNDLSQPVKHMKNDPQIESTPKKTAKEKQELLEISKQKEAVREKKRNKRKQKKLEKAKQKETSKSIKSDEKVEIAKTEALNYLECWKKKRSEWTFKKIRQVWLLQHMYNQETVCRNELKILLYKYRLNKHYKSH